LGGVTASQSQAFSGLLLALLTAIVLLDLVNQYRAKGLDARTAVVEGGRRRLRPILMTAIATILALLPMALGLNKAGVFIAGPLAIVVIGGLTSSTILTLLVVPTLYVIVEDIRESFGRKRTSPLAPPARGEDLESRSRDEKEREPQEQYTPPFVEEQAEPEKRAHPLASEQTDSAPKRSRALLGLTLALIAQEAQLPEADPQILATLSSAAAGRYPQTWSEEQTGRAVARDLLEPLSIKLLASSTDNGREHAHENNRLRYP
ncbi:MAG TPA: efflux RND transporter permease subunit, partial [Ktedonobacteraceae bacterium]